MRTNNSTATLLMGLVVISALLSLGLFWANISKERELRNIRTQAAAVNNNRAIISALAGEALEYSKKNPSINPILESAGIKPNSAPAK